MTPQQKTEYQDCVKYLMQYAKTIEMNRYMQKYCLDVAKKAKFLHDLKPHLFYGTGMKEYIEDRIGFYKRNKEYNTENKDYNAEKHESKTV